TRSKRDWSSDVCSSDLIRVAGDPAAALPMVRKAIASIDSDVPVTETMPLMDQVRGAYTDTRVASAVLSCAALLALILSGMGLYEIGRASCRERVSGGAG